MIGGAASHVPCSAGACRPARRPPAPTSGCSARKLVAYIDGGGQDASSQALEAAGRTSSSTPRRCARPPQSSRRRTEGPLHVLGRRCAELRVGARRRSRPRGRAACSPARARVVDVRARAAEAGLGTGSARATPRRHDPDGRLRRLHRRASMHAPDSGWKEEWKCNTTYSKPEQKASFDRALGNIGLLYGHSERRVQVDGDAAGAGRRPEARVPTVEAGRTSSGASATSRRRHEQPRHRRGRAEGERAAMIKERPWSARHGGAARAPQLRESEEELAAQGDHREPGTLGALTRGGRGAPVSLRTLRRSSRRRCSPRLGCQDLRGPVPRRRRAAARGRGGAVFSSYAWTAADWRHMGGALACCPKLWVLLLRGWARTMRRWPPRRHARQRRGARAETLDLGSNEIGDEGMRHLGDVAARRPRSRPRRSTSLPGESSSRSPRLWTWMTTATRGAPLAAPVARGGRRHLEGCTSANQDRRRGGCATWVPSNARGAAPALYASASASTASPPKRYARDRWYRADWIGREGGCSTRLTPSRRARLRAALELHARAGLNEIGWDARGAPPGRPLQANGAAPALEKLWLSATRRRPGRRPRARRGAPLETRSALYGPLPRPRRSWTAATSAGATAGVAAAEHAHAQGALETLVLGGNSATRRAPPRRRDDGRA